MTGQSGRNAYRLAAALAVAAAVLQVWMNLAAGIVGAPDNPQNQGFYGIVVVAAAGAFVARGRADGMVRAMLATAAAQALLGLMVATAPITARDPMGAGGVVLLSGLFVALWLIAAALFRRSAKGEAFPY